MDLDKSLDDMIGSKKRSNTSGNTTSNNNVRGGAKPRQSRERSDVPYAVCYYSSVRRCIRADTAQRPPPRSTEDKWVHDAFQGGNRRGGGAGSFGGGRQVADVAGTGAAFTGVSPRIEVVGLHYEVTPQDLKVCSSYRRGCAQADAVDDLFSGWNFGSRSYYPCKRLNFIKISPYLDSSIRAFFLKRYAGIYGGDGIKINQIPEYQDQCSC